MRRLCAKQETQRSRYNHKHHHDAHNIPVLTRHTKQTVSDRKSHVDHIQRTQTEASTPHTPVGRAAPASRCLSAYLFLPLSTALGDLKHLTVTLVCEYLWAASLSFYEQLKLG